MNIEPEKQTLIIQENMLKYINGVEYWHNHHDEMTGAHYHDFT